MWREKEILGEHYEVFTGFLWMFPDRVVMVACSCLPPLGRGSFASFVPQRWHTGAVRVLSPFGCTGRLR